MPFDPDSFEGIRRMGHAQNLWETRDLLKYWAMLDEKRKIEQLQGGLLGPPMPTPAIMQQVYSRGLLK